jgi:transposase
MLTLSGTTPIYLYRGPVDLRKSFDGLSGLVRAGMTVDPLSGALFVFCNRRRTMVKLLYWDVDGWVIFHKRLERGTFWLPSPASADARIDRRSLSMLLEGVTPGRWHRRYSRTA